MQDYQTLEETLQSWPSVHLVVGFASWPLDTGMIRLVLRMMKEARGLNYCLLANEGQLLSHERQQFNNLDNMHVCSSVYFIS